MDPKLVYWTAALVNLLAVVVCAAAGVRRIRRGELRAHRRLMLTAAALVGLFLVSYLGKLAALGREDRSLWTDADLAVLYLHEGCIAVMLIGGGLAGSRAWRFRRTLGAGPLRDRKSRAGDRVWHRRAGWAAVVACAFAFATAAGVLAGMYARAGDRGALAVSTGPDETSDRVE
jgi:hypothetical protein